MGLGFSLLILLNLYLPQGNGCFQELRQLSAQSAEISSQEEKLLKLLQLTPPSPEWLAAYRILSQEWNLQEALELVEANPAARKEKLHAVFKLPTEVLDEIIRNIESLSRSVTDKKAESSIRKTLGALFSAAKNTQRTLNFINEVKHSEFVGLWYELRTAAYYANKDYKIIFFRQPYSMRDLEDPELNHQGEIDLLVESPEGKIILVEVKKRLHHQMKYQREFDRFYKILKRQTSFGWEVDEVHIFVPESLSAKEASILNQHWPEFIAVSFDDKDQRPQRFFLYDYP